VVSPLLALALTIYFVHRSDDNRLFGVYLLTMIGGGLLSVVPHEIGHALAAAASGARQIVIRIGIPIATRTRAVGRPGLRVEFGPPRRGTGGDTRFSPTPGPYSHVLILLAGPLSGAAALAIAALTVPTYEARAGLVTACVLHLAANLIPNAPSTSSSDGTQLRGLARPETRAAIRALRGAERDLPGPRTTDGLSATEDRRLAVLEKALSDPALNEKARSILRAPRAGALWAAGRFLESAHEFEPLKDCQDGWADAFVTAALFGQLRPPNPQLATAAALVETRATKSRSIDAAHTLAVLRLVQGRPEDAWLALSTPSQRRLTPSQRAAVLATQALAAPDASNRERLFREAREADPNSVWPTLEGIYPGQSTPVSLTRLQ
jgi:hypothetical protein